jgi:hypothetical protein
MGTLKFIFILLLCICKSIYSADCGTPVECYSKAIAQLNQDRTEMRRQLDTYQELYKGVVKENENLKASVESLKATFNENLEKTKIDFQTKLDQMTKYVDRPWTAISKMVYVGKTLSTNIAAIPLNSIVPATAKKVLIYAAYFSGVCPYEVHGNVNIFTNVNGQMSRRSFNVSPYNQNAYDTNSSVFEMDLDGVDYNLYYSSNFNYTCEHLSFQIEILGYK